MLHKILAPTVLLLLMIPANSVGQESSREQSQIDFYSRMTQQYLREQRPDLAIPELEQLIAIDPDNVDARGNLGVLLFFRENYQEAIPQMRAALKLQPSLWKIQALLGLAEARLGNKDASREELEIAFPHLTEKKIQAEAGQALIDEYTATGELEKAATVASSLLASRPTDVSLLYMAYRLYSDLAGKTMLTLALSAPESAQMHEVMARELARRGDNFAAIANYREAIRIDPQVPGLHSELGDLLYHSSDAKLQADAEPELKAAMALDPRDVRALITLGIIAEKRGDIDAAYTAYSHALGIDPNNSDACTDLAEVLVSMNQRERAQQMFERAVQIDPTNYVAHYRLGTLYREAGRKAEAKQQVLEYLKYKQMKDKLEQIFREMRVPAGRFELDDQDEDK